MAKTHFKPEPSHEVFSLLASVIERWHPVVHKLTPALSLGVLFVSVDDPEKEVPLKHHGHQAAAIIRVVSQRDRAAGGPDVLLEIDSHQWNDMDDDEKTSLLDHECVHVDFPGAKQSPDGTAWWPETDSLDRPKVGMRPHDWECGGFYSIVERHGQDAHEKKYLDRVNEKLRQKTLPFAEESPANHTVTFSNPNGDKSVTITGDQLRRIAVG